MSVNPLSGSSSAANTVASSASSAQEQTDRFMKLLVAQMQNQDPLNPLDNAQVTSQMAQISTVSGIESLNTTVAGLNSQFVQLQALQSASLIGRDVAIEGDTLRQTDGQGDGGFELAGPADDVTVTIKDAAGNTVGTIELEDLEAGRHDFEFEVPEAYRDSELSFEVEATRGESEVDVMTLVHERVQAVSNFGGTLALELVGGERVSYDAVWAVL